MSDRKPEPDQEAGEVVFSLALGILFTMPLLANTVTELFGFHVFFLADPKIQFVWGSTVQAGAGWPFYRGAYRHARSGSIPGDLAVAAGTTAAYGYSVYRTFSRPPVSGLAVPVLYEATAVFLTLMLAGRLRATLVRNRRSHSKPGA